MSEVEDLGLPKVIWIGLASEGLQRALVERGWTVANPPDTSGT